ncbi:alpha-hydroxy acid oxidase [Achromobacter xylosoxidans]|uniref:alpha-hydroxy acid oxidase n=1 Tax=Alcaligenes xylosoxydans xylosoxydans TaxID=85698 RepID=UPI0003320B02|nr:alpha-hydroxy acid oxidase [Achromobacter xylosoxidans]MCH1997218.1 alpha-hydroxy-acid oxidizing protein [Achromobacter xylosoxidans]CCH07980.1 L-lactate dehydrogenase [Achromobacter xylosoxidans NH44784-1996]
MSDPLRRMLSLHDFEAAARQILPKPLYAYVSGAVEDGQSERGNRQAYDDYGFRPKVLVDVSRRSTRCTVLGREYAAPVGVAPMGIAALTSYRGDVILARAAAEAGVPCIMSGSSLIRLETVMEAAPGTWFQAYLPGDGAQIAALIDRVAAAGVDTLVLTVDTPVAANRENNVRAGFSTPLRPSVGLAWQGVTHPRWLIGTFLRTLLRHGMPHFENNYATRGAPILSGNVLRDFSDRGHLNWQHVAAIRKTWKGRMVLKGILHPDDARAARAHGMDAVIVSNHGGRQLDGSVSPLHALPAIVDAAGGMDVMLDSGVRRGTDALKAMALGARCVFVGRPFNYAATVAGQRGVAHAIALIVEEIRRNMGLLGIVDLREVNQSLLQRSR